ncbi:hypothetical protein [Candidatus Methylocalor cossyra]|uniref:Uncharacterized protein n=1 Tax=Candidatus Methylocalor cossyra TaxID=3108543 RepID=A0ABM9NFM4_9GAMM
MTDRPQEPLPERGEADIRTKALIAAVAVFGIAVLAVGLITWQLLQAWVASTPAPAPPSRSVATGVPLQLAPAADLAALRAREEQLLHGTAWIDRERGLVRIPVERAMELLAKRAAPAPGPRRGE